MTSSGWFLARRRRQVLYHLSQWPRHAGSFSERAEREREPTVRILSERDALNFSAAAPRAALCPHAIWDVELCARGERRERERCIISFYRARILLLLLLGLINLGADSWHSSSLDPVKFKFRVFFLGGIQKMHGLFSAWFGFFLIFRGRRRKILFCSPACVWKKISRPLNSLGAVLWPRCAPLSHVAALC